MVCCHVLRMNPFPRCISMESKKPLDPSRIGFLRSRGVVLGHTRLMDLIEESHGCRMTRKDTDVNMRDKRDGRSNEDAENLTEYASMLVCRAAH